MPVYEYRCSACSVETEVIVLPPESPPETCAECGGALHRLWSRVGARFVGWGFSSTDSLVPERPNRADFKTVRDKAAELFD